MTPPFAEADITSTMSDRGQPKVLNTTNGDPGPRVSIFEASTSHLASMIASARAGEFVATNRVIVNVIGHDARRQVVCLVEKHRLPRGPDRNRDRRAFPASPRGR